MMKPNFDVKKSAVYMDNAATTMMDDEVVHAMQPYLEERFGNPETPYHLGQEAREAVEEAREFVAQLMDAPPDRVFFTSGGTESNNWAMKCFNGGDVNVVSSWAEHKSILYSLKERGFFIDVDDKCRVDIDGIEQNVKQEMDDMPNLASVQHANNEVGTIQPVEEIVNLCRKYGASYHMDAVQTYGKLRFSVRDLDVDMASVSAHKIHGPMGIGALYVKEDVELQPLFHGGSQEGGMRAGTLAVPLIVGFGKAAELAWSQLDGMAEVAKNRDAIETILSERVEGVRFNGDLDNRVPHITSITLPDGIEAAMVAAYLDNQYGLCVACGSACATRTGKSHVLEAMGFSAVDNYATLRVSLSRFNTISHSHDLVCGIESAILDAKARELD